jgi:hypothetical protein
MILEQQPGRYRLHGLDSSEAEAVLAEVGVTHADLDRALAALERSEGIRVRSIVGVNRDAVRLYPGRLAPRPVRRLQGATAAI